MCVNEYLQSLKNAVWKQQIYVNNGNKWEGKDSKNVRKLDTVILPDEIKNEIKNDLELFLNSEEWYLHRDIPYTRGYLFYGLPGTGKTSLIKALSLHYKLHISFLMLQNVMSDNELIELLQNIDYKTTILIIEDIDAMIDLVKSREEQAKKDVEKEQNEFVICDDSYKKRDYGTDVKILEDNKKSTLTFSGILNALDGVFNNHRRIMFMTTNKPEILDQALIRAGRCDMRKQFNFCNHDQIKELYRMFFEKDAPKGQIEQIKSFMYSPAHISAVFIRYRNEPETALLHLDDFEQKVVIKPMIETEVEIN
jgi:ATP-dependent 26S proteasome regulatory subunit